jgi:hypothetical protein
LETLKSLRCSGTPITTSLARAILVASLKQHGLDFILSQHLLDKDGAVDSSKFMAGQKWLSQWLRDTGMSWRAVTGDHGKLPDDWLEQCDQSGVLGYSTNSLLPSRPNLRLLQASCSVSTLIFYYHLMPFHISTIRIEMLQHGRFITEICVHNYFF